MRAHPVWLFSFVLGCGSGSPRRSHPDASTVPDAGGDDDAGPLPDTGCTVDEDGDGHLAPVCGGDDCDDADGTTYPGADAAEIAREWEIDSIDAHEGASALLLDADEVPHVFFIGAGAADGSDFVHATRDGDDWETETIDDVGETGHCPSAVLAEDGTFHVVFCEVWSGSVYYASGPDPWERELVATTGTNMVQHSAIALAADGFPRFVYDEGSPARVQYAVKSDAGWSVETVHSTRPVPVVPTFAIDSEGIEHVSWVDYAVFDARHEGGVWIVETVDDYADEGPPALVVDSWGRLQLFYTERSDDGEDAWLVRAIRENGIWLRAEIVDSTPSYAPRPIAAPAGRIEVAYSAGIGRFFVANDLREDWWTEDVAGGAAVWDLSMARDAVGGLHVSTSVGRSGLRRGADALREPHLRYAYRPGADGIDQNCDGADGIDADGDGHASLESFGDDCDDSEPGVHGGMEDPPGLGDLNCDGVD